MSAEIPLAPRLLSGAATSGVPAVSFANDAAIRDATDNKVQTKKPIINICEYSAVVVFWDEMGNQGTPLMIGQSTTY